MPMIIDFLLLHHHSSHDIKCMCFNLTAQINKNNWNPFGGYSYE